MAGGNIWKEEEIAFLKRNYSYKTNRELKDNLGRSLKSINFMAWKLKLKKSEVAYSRARKRSKIEITKDILFNLYYDEKRSVREIAKSLGVGKTTIEYYFHKYQLKNRTKSEAGSYAYIKYGNWKKGKTKKNNEKVYQSIEKMKNTWKKKEKKKLEKIEEQYHSKINEIVRRLYWEENLNQDKIAEGLGLSRLSIIKIMKQYKIDKRPNYEKISILNKEHHPMLGKKWEDIYGVEEAAKLKIARSEWSGQNIIRRLKNREMPFKETLIEKKISRELNKRNIQFTPQYSIDGKFVCDFALPEFKIIIECDGDYWHANPEIYDTTKLTKTQSRKVETDKYKDKYLQEKGWTVLRFFESKIKRSASECIDKVQEEIKKVANPLDSL